MKFKERVDRTFARYGEDFLINGVTPAKGFFQRGDCSRTPACFDDEEGPAAGQTLILMIPAGTAVEIGNTVSRDGQTRTVRKISKQRVKDTVVMQVLLLT